MSAAIMKDLHEEPPEDIDSPDLDWQDIKHFLSDCMTKVHCLELLESSLLEGSKLKKPILDGISDCPSYPASLQRRYNWKPKKEYIRLNEPEVQESVQESLPAPKDLDRRSYVASLQKPYVPKPKEDCTHSSEPAVEASVKESLPPPKDLPDDLSYVDSLQKPYKPEPIKDCIQSGQPKEQVQHAMEFDWGASLLSLLDLQVPKAAQASVEPRLLFLRDFPDCRSYVAKLREYYEKKAEENRTNSCFSAEQEQRIKEFAVGVNLQSSPNLQAPKAAQASIKPGLPLLKDFPDCRSYVAKLREHYEKKAEENRVKSCWPTQQEQRIKKYFTGANLLSESDYWPNDVAEAPPLLAESSADETAGNPMESPRSNSSLGLDSDSESADPDSAPEETAK